jgi:hypothetical protein
MSRNVVKFTVLCLVFTGGRMGLAAENASDATKTGNVKEGKEHASVVTPRIPRAIYLRRN